MQFRKLSRVIAFAALGLLACWATSCGTLVQVVDSEGSAVAGAHVMVVYPSFDGLATVTDDAGRTRLADGWIRTLLLPQPLEVSAVGRSQVARVTYPPPPVIRQRDK